jgi:hypothetical protein
MNLYIETENGTFKNHPAFENNLIQAFGTIPTHWEPFIRVEKPEPGVYQVLQSDKPVYTKIDGVWKDVWTIRDMTAEEKTAKQQAVIEVFKKREYATNWSAWTLDEATNTMVPPIARSARNPMKIGLGIFTYWCGADNDWKDTPRKPFDEKQYKFDFNVWQWVEVLSDVEVVPNI